MRRNSALKSCGHCKTILKKPRWCPCKNAMYCNRECQKKHWKVHKEEFHNNNKTEEKKPTAVPKANNMWSNISYLSKGGGQTFTKALFFYKGTAYPAFECFTSKKKAIKHVQTIIDFAKQMIKKNLKEGIDKKSQVSNYIRQMDYVENALVEWEAQGHTPEDFELFAKQKYNPDDCRIFSWKEWALNSMALMVLGKIRDDDMNGPQLLTTCEGCDIDHFKLLKMS